MAESTVGSTVRLELPSRAELPLFVYGLLAPGQPAHQRVLGDLVAPPAPATMTTGALRIRDGLPVLDSEASGGVEGFLLTPLEGRGRALYDAVCAFEPRNQYRWLVAQVLSGPGTAPANTLQGRHPERGSTEESFRGWTAADDPGLGAGMHHVRQAALRYGPPPPPRPGDAHAAMWERFFGLQATYLLLWSLVDRYTAVAYGPAEEPLTRAHLLGADPSFRAHVVEAGVAPRAKVADSRDPTRWRRIRDDGSGAVYSWEAVRTTLGHPGRTATTDLSLLRRSLVELHDSFRLHLLDQIPALGRTWTPLDPDGSGQKWQLRPAFDPEGLA